MRVDNVCVGEVGELIDESLSTSLGEGVEETRLATFPVGLLLGNPAAFEETFEKRVDSVVVELLLLCEHGGVLFEAVSVFGTFE